MRVVHLTTSGELGGAETSLLALLESVREAEPGWELSVLAPAGGRLLDRLDASGICGRVLPFPAALARVGESGGSGSPGILAATAAAVSSAVYVSRLATALREERPAVIHAHGFKMHLLSALARPVHAAVVWHVHSYLSGRAWTASALRRLAPRASAILANSGSVAEDLKRHLGARTDVQTLYNAVDLHRFVPDGAVMDLDSASSLAPASSGTVRVGLVGTFGRWKGHDVFLEALARLPSVPPVRGYIIGAPIYATAGSQLTLDELGGAVRVRGLDGRVGFTGFVDDVPSAMRSLDVIVHASTEPEPFGMVIAEAMACGRAVVASRSGGASELFTEGVDALGHRPGDAAELARALARLVSDPELRARLGGAARRRAEHDFDRRRLAAAVVPLYRTLAAA